MILVPLNRSFGMHSTVQQGAGTALNGVRLFASRFRNETRARSAWNGSYRRISCRTRARGMQALLNCQHNIYSLKFKLSGRSGISILPVIGTLLETISKSKLLNHT